MPSSSSSHSITDFRCQLGGLLDVWPGASYAILVMSAGDQPRGIATEASSWCIWARCTWMRERWQDVRIQFARTTCDCRCTMWQMPKIATSCSAEPRWCQRAFPQCRPPHAFGNQSTEELGRLAHCVQEGVDADAGALGQDRHQPLINLWATRRARFHQLPPLFQLLLGLHHTIQWKTSQQPIA